MDDLRAVMDAADFDKAALVGISEGGPMCILFAATHPDRTSALITIGAYPRRTRTDDYPWGWTVEQHEAFLDEIERGWGGPVGLAKRAPHLASDETFSRWWSSYLRSSASPSAALALTKMNAQIDVRSALSTVSVPALIIHRTDDQALPVEGSRYLAERIPGAKLVELPGDDHLPWVGKLEETFGRA